MESRTRVEAALALHVADRPPVAWWGHTFVEEWSPQQLAQVSVERARRYNWDFVKFQPRASCFAEAFGARFSPSGNAEEPPVQTGQVVHEPADWKSLALREPKALQDQVEAIRAVTSALGPSVPVIQTIFSPLTVAGYLVGVDKQHALDQLRADPEVVEPALGQIGETLAQFAAASISAGAAGIFYAISGYAGADMTSAKEYRDLAFEQDRSILESLPPGAWFNVLHLCGRRVHFDLAGALPVQVVSWSIHDEGNPSLSEGRDSSGKAVMGGLARHATVLNGPADAVLEEGRKALSETGGRGLLLAPGCSVPVEAPDANLAAIGEVFR